MSLSCSCDWDYEPEPGQWFYWGEHTWFVPLDTSKRKRCCSCAKLIDIGALCIKHPRYRHPYNEVEARIYNVDWYCPEEPPIKIADHYHCERCGELWLNLTALGFECLAPNEYMETSLKEYHEITGFKAA